MHWACNGDVSSSQAGNTGASSAVASVQRCAGRNHGDAREYRRARHASVTCGSEGVVTCGERDEPLERDTGGNGVDGGKIQL